jgi:hypothetical protein
MVVEVIATVAGGARTATLTPVASGMDIRRINAGRYGADRR